jgi:hypothetical protein
MSEGLFVETQRLVTALIEGENVKAREIMKSWPKSAFLDLLNVITQVVVATQQEEDFIFHKEVSKGLMVLSCKYPELDDIWNAAIHDDVSIHFDDFKPFMTACQCGNLSMVRDFRRFQYDEEDGRKMIPDEVWERGAAVAKKAGSTEVYDWIKQYLKSGTDDEEDDEECECAGKCEGECDGECDDKCECEECDCGVEVELDDDEKAELEAYERVHQRLKADRELKRKLKKE